MHDHSPTRRPGVAAEEERAWVGVYRRVGRDAAAAADVLSQLDRDPEMKRQHLALYLSCQAALRRHKAQQDRQQRLAGCLRRAWHRLLGRSMPDPTALPDPARPEVPAGPGAADGFAADAERLAAADLRQPGARGIPRGLPGCHTPIIEICVLRNRVNGSNAAVGNCCVKKFIGIASHLIFDGIKRVRRNPTSALNEAWIDHASAGGWIIEWGEEFLVSTKRKRF